MNKELVQDGLIAQSEAQSRTFSGPLGKIFPEANRLVGSIVSADISLPLGELADFIRQRLVMKLVLLSDCQINCFGHVGDGNLAFQFI